MRSQQGSASIELAIIVPVLLLVVLGTVQVAIWHHANNTARSAASACAERARGFDHTLDDGAAAAQRTLDQVDGLTEVSVEVTGDATTVVCRVSGNAPTLVHVGPQISQAVTMPRERLG